jgi:tetratricopeptide (TPR) repeat protein
MVDHRGDERRRGGNRSPARTDRPRDPEIDDEVTGRELDHAVREELRTLPGQIAGAVSRHLVMAGRLLDEDPELAYQHTLAARRRAARVGVVREAVGVAAYTSGRYAEALSELRAARRIIGSPEYLPMMADCERGLGRPRRALDLASDPAVEDLDTAGRVEMLIVAAGARRDLGELDAAVVSLQVPELRSRGSGGWVARLRYAYADALLAAGREDEARRWFVRAADADVDAETDAAERAAALDGILLVEDDEEPAPRGDGT